MEATKVIRGSFNGVISGLYGGYVGIMETKMETTI